MKRLLYSLISILVLSNTAVALDGPGYVYGGAKKLSVSQANTTTTLSADANCVKVDNIGDSLVFVRVGEGASGTAVVDVDAAIQPGGKDILRLPGKASQFIAAITDTGGSATVYAISGFCSK